MTPGDLNDELQSHLEFQIRKHIAAGMSEPEARRRAQIEFGGFEAAKEACRDVERRCYIDSAWRSLRYALRSLRKNPVFSLAAIVIFAIGIGTTIAAFGVADALLLRPLPIPHPRDLVRIASVNKTGNLGQLPSTMVDPLKRSPWLEGVCGFNSLYEGVAANGSLTSEGVLGFTGDCFSTLQTRTQLGRPLIAADDDPGATPVGVITGAFWRSAFGGRTDVIGQTIKLPGLSVTIVGITEDRFAGLLLGFPAAVIIPLHHEPSDLPGHAPQVWWWVNIVGRLSPGDSVREANAALTAQAGSLLEQSIPPRYDAVRRRGYLTTRLTAAPAANGIDYFMRDRFGASAIAVLGICAVILAIACVNVANLLLARSLRRRKEISVRLALGASRAQAARMLALESSLLVLAGAVAGMPVVLGINRFISARGAEMFGNFAMSFTLDWRIATFAAAVVIGIAAALAAASAFQATRLCSGEALHSAGSRVAQGNGSGQKVLIAIQIALTLALVSGAALFSSSLRSLYKVAIGIDTQNVCDVLLSSRPGSEQSVPASYHRDLIDQVKALPSVSSVALTDFAPFLNTTGQDPVKPFGNSDRSPEVHAHVAAVTDGFFSLMGIRLEEGRDFLRTEIDASEPVAVVSRSLADHFGGSELLGHSISIGSSRQLQRVKVVGVASNALLDLVDPTQPEPPMVYLNLWQQPQMLAGYSVMLVKTSGAPLPAAMIRSIVNQAGQQYVERASSLDVEKDGGLAENRLMAYLSGMFAMLALALAGAGLFALLSYHVASRVSEIGIRMALGASAAQVQTEVLRQVVPLVVAGSTAGVVLAFAEGKAISSLLFGVRGANPAYLAFSTLVLTIAATIAAIVPARRAARIDPMVALRCE